MEFDPFKISKSKISAEPPKMMALIVSALQTLADEADDIHLSISGTVGLSAYDTTVNDYLLFCHLGPDYFMSSYIDSDAEERFKTHIKNVVVASMIYPFIDCHSAAVLKEIPLRFEGMFKKANWTEDQMAAIDEIFETLSNADKPENFGRVIVVLDSMSYFAEIGGSSELALEIHKTIMRLTEGAYKRFQLNRVKILKDMGEDDAQSDE